MNRDFVIRTLRATAPSSACWGPAKGHVSLSSVIAEPEKHGLKSLVVSHPAESVTFSPPEWYSPGSEGAFCDQVPEQIADQVATFEGCRFIGLDGLLITKADQLLSEVLMQPGGNFDAHPAMRSPWYGRVNRVRKKVAIISSRFSNNYYHWLFDILPRFEMVRQAGISPDVYYLHVAGDFQRESLAMLGIPDASLMPALPRAQFAADSVILPLVPGGLEGVSAWTVRHLREKLVGSRNIKKQRLIYISRAKAQTRKVLNEDEVRTFLERRGFETVFLEELSFQEQVATLASARAVVAAHGAGLANIVFCESGTPIIECFRGDYVNALYFRLARLCGHPYAAIIDFGDDPAYVGMNQFKVVTPFKISLSDLEAALSAMGI